MKTSESIKEIAAALPKAQAAIKTAVKGARNPHFNSKYSDLATIIEACKEALNSHGITFLQPVRATERGIIVETILLHSSAEWISEELELPVAKHDAQGLGSAITYGKRYGLQSLVGIPSEDDDGNAAVEKSAAAKWGDKTSAASQLAGEQKHGSNGAEVCQIAFAALSVDQQMSMRLHASIMLNMSDVDATAYMRAQNIVGEDKLALWHLLPAPRRAGIKRIEVANPTPTEMATQA